MNIYGSKVYLRAIEERDNEMLLEMINDPETEKMLGGYSWPISITDQKKWFEGQSNKANILRCIVSVKETDIAVGTVILSDIDLKNGTAEIHIKLSTKNGRGKGYGTDAVNTLVSYAFKEMRLNCIYANILTYNTASAHLFEKCGFVKEGVLRSRVYKEGAFIDFLSYSIVRGDPI